MITNYNSVLDELEGRKKDSSSSTAKKAYAAQLMIGGAGDPGHGSSVDVIHYGEIETIALIVMGC